MVLIAKTADTLCVSLMRIRPLLRAVTVLAFLAGAIAQAQQYSFQYYGVDQGLTDRSQAAALAESIRRAIEKLEIRHPNSPTGANVTISLGIATAIDDRFPTANALVGAADSALYSAKQLGRNRAESFDSTPTRSVNLDLTRISSAQPVLSAR
jgi:predicted signal transduction protein with EAL and GGDEF domain